MACGARSVRRETIGHVKIGMRVVEMGEDRARAALGVVMWGASVERMQARMQRWSRGPSVCCCRGPPHATRGLVPLRNWFCHRCGEAKSGLAALRRLCRGRVRCRCHVDTHSIYVPREGGGLTHRSCFMAPIRSPTSPLNHRAVLTAFSPSVLLMMMYDGYDETCFMQL